MPAAALRSALCAAGLSRFELRRHSASSPRNSPREGRMSLPISYCWASLFSRSPSRCATSCFRFPISTLMRYPMRPSRPEPVLDTVPVVPRGDVSTVPPI